VAVTKIHFYNEFQKKIYIYILVVECVNSHTALRKYVYTYIGGCIQKIPDKVDNEINNNNNNNKHSFGSNTKGYGDKTN